MNEVANKPLETDSKSSEELAGVKKELQKMQKRFEEAVNRSQGPVSGEPPRKRKLLLSAAIVAGALSVAWALVSVFANRLDVTWAATADSSANTTVINFGFDASVFRLISGNITIVPGSGSATMGELTGRRRARSLEVFMERAGTVHITIDRPGIETRTETVALSNVPVPIVPGRPLGKPGNLARLTPQANFCDSCGSKKKLPHTHLTGNGMADKMLKRIRTAVRTWVLRKCGCQ